MYAIARWLPLAGRRVAVQATYRATVEGMYPRADGEWCPLGVAVTGAELFHPSSPSSSDVVKAICQLRACGWSWAEEKVVIEQAKRFIDDWDRGKVKDLGRAFGVRARRRAKD